MRLVGEEKEPLGIMTRAEALAAATAAELDLVRAGWLGALASRVAHARWGPAPAR